ncbi:MAG: aminomethyl-transferring glycine dehydrogenase [Bacteroidia bacterium]
MSYFSFADRHIGPDSEQVAQMLNLIGVSSLEQLIDETVPAAIRIKGDLNLPDALSETAYLKHIKSVSLKNKVFRSYIGLGYYNTVVPGVVQRNVFENPGWYTAYTPYQAEIAQGRMEALLNFQTMVCDLTGMELANASLLDEATAAAETMHMFYASRSKEQEKNNCKKYFVSDKCFPQTISVLKTRSNPVGVELVVGDYATTKLDDTYFGALLQYPDIDGEVHNYMPFVKHAHEHNIYVAVAADIMSLAMLMPPGEWGADAVVGSTQRFGVPLGYGGPHAAYFATHDKFKRDIPGRIIGVSVDTTGKRALRMALQTREQHIKREKATSNICTAQVLLAVMSSMYAVYHGPKGIRSIAENIHENTFRLKEGLTNLGYEVLNKYFFDTIKVAASGKVPRIQQLALEKKINFRYNSDETVCISLDETVDATDLKDILNVFEAAAGKQLDGYESKNLQNIFMRSESFLMRRQSAFLTHPVFNKYHSEHEMLRYMKRLEDKDLAMNHSMISLGSCTMKLNATAEMSPLSWPEFGAMHPFVPIDQAAGYQQMIKELENYLSEITGFAAASLQPNSGAQGEYAGLLVIREYLKQKGEGHRYIVLIPQSAHGTNPASAVMCGYKIEVVKTDDKGNIDIHDLKLKAERHAANLAALMVTYPSTHGVYEEGIKEITSIIHANGGQVYMDGANMNAQVGLTSPGMIGADVCHLNLHKTFSIPHGGGGPGMGPIGVAKHLAPYLPTHPLTTTGGEKGVDAVSAAPWGSASILHISYAYIRMLGKKGVRNATIAAILNANYIQKRLENHYPILYRGSKGRSAHEMILDCRAFKTNAGVEVTDIAKRLMDYGFHAPTVSFPVAGTLMVEPTESETMEELDRFCDAMISIRKEIDDIEKGIADKLDNVLANSPHTVTEVTANDWHHPYTRQQAAFPAHYVSENKFWPSVKRVDNAFGDRNLVCTCPPMEEYMEEVA